MIFEDPVWIPYLKLILASALGFIIGVERKALGKCVGPRTYSLICIGACVFTILNVMVSGSDTSYRFAGQIISGLGFLGAGVIFKSHDHVVGITTAASIWVAASVGMLVGFGYYGLSIFTTVLIVLFLHLKEEKFIHPTC